MNFCSHCGQAVTLEVPAGDNRPRHVCKSCGRIHYQNPLVVVGCVPVYEGQILLCRRAIEPRHGFWTVPAGFMELGETLGEAAIRETWEEAEAQVELGALFAVVDVVQARQVHVFFHGRLTAPVFGAGEETLETRLFPPGQIPWSEIAFPSVCIALERCLDAGFDSKAPVLLVTAPGRALT
ncbi:MAG: NUDIX hydrolase [Gammaproteobacteria bacterium]|nr:NUDIX hydrolase [Gammaproteobacteria bacterium]